MFCSVTREDFDEHVIDITFMITNKCNYNCKYCIEKIPQEKAKVQNLDLQKMTQFIYNYKNAYPNNKINVRIYGGEPTLHSSLFDFCKQLNSISEIQIVEIFTNFSASCDIFCDLLKLEKLHLFTSYHTNCIMSENDYLEKLYKVCNITNASEKITCNIMLENNNKDFQSKTYKLYKQLISLQKKQKCNSLIELIPLFSTAYYDSVYDKQYSKLFDLVNKLNNIKVKFLLADFDGSTIIEHKVCGYDSYNFKGWQCTSGKNAIFIDPYGYIYPCGGLYTKRNEFKKMFIKNIFDYIDNIKAMFECTICPHSDCVLCVPMKVTNVNYIDIPIDNTDEKFTVKE